jgi:hypothetical protein
MKNIDKPQVFKLVQLLSGLPEHRNALAEFEPHHFPILWQLERLYGILVPDNVDFPRVPLPKPVENENEELLEQVEHLVIVHFDGHLQIKPDEL